MLFFKNNEKKKHNVAEKEHIHDLITNIDGYFLFPPCLFFIDLILSITSAGCILGVLSHKSLLE
jgi:hypothetical protein